MGPDGQKLSKRHGATSVFAYREAGYFPEALLNYLARLGWSHGDQEIFSKQELIEYFDFEACGKSAGDFQRRETSVAEFSLPEGAAACRSSRARCSPFIERAGLHEFPATTRGSKR